MKKLETKKGGNDPLSSYANGANCCSGGPEEQIIAGRRSETLFNPNTVDVPMMPSRQQHILFRVVTGQSPRQLTRVSVKDY